MLRKLIFFPALFAMCLICCGSVFAQCTETNGISFCVTEGCGSVEPKIETTFLIMQTPVAAIITPCAGYVISDVKVDGDSKGAIKTYNFPNGFINAHHMIEASFIKKLQKRQNDNSQDQSESYYWFEGECDKSLNTREIQCKNSEDSVVDDNYCPSESKPSENCENSSEPSENSYSWYVGNWNACENRIQRRDVKCKDDNNKTVVEESYCSDIKPNSTQSCGIVNTVSNLLNTNNDSGGGGCFITTVFGR